MHEAKKQKSIFKSGISVLFGIYIIIGMFHAFYWLIKQRIDCVKESWFGFFWCDHQMSHFGLGLKYASELLFWPLHYI